MNKFISIPCQQFIQFQLVLYFTLIFLVLLQSGTHAACENDRYPAFKTEELHCQTPTITPTSKQGGSSYDFYDGLWTDRAGT